MRGFTPRCLLAPVRTALFVSLFDNHEMVTDFIITGVTGLSFASQRVLPIFITTSMPLVTFPNTGCCEGD